MGRLYFVGLGLHDARSITLEALELCKSTEMLFMERYTSILTEGAIDDLAKRIGKSIRLLSREEAEKGDFLSFAKDRSVALLIPGDPMTATTHIDLRIRAHDMGIETRIIHGTSALVAIPGILGLQHYKFGRTITIPYPQKGFDPISPFEQLMENRRRGLHTLSLLDIQSAQERFMTANEGLKWMLDSAARIGERDFTESILACVVARAGAENYIAKANSIKELMPMDFGSPLHTIVIPGKLHFEEIEALKRFADAPEDIGSD